MSLDVYLSIEPCACCGREFEYVFHENITHNLSTMADAAGVYVACWRPEEAGVTRAGQLIEQLRAGLRWLGKYKNTARLFEPENGWGTYSNLVHFLDRYLATCEKFPYAIVKVSR